MGRLDAEIGARVAAFRDQRGHTQTAMAEALGVTPSTASRMEKGGVPWTAERMSAVADFLGLEVRMLWPNAERTPHLGTVLSADESRAVAALRRGDEVEALRAVLDILRITRK